MQSTTPLELNLQYPNYTTTMHAVQNDKLSRKISAVLVDGATAWTPPAGTDAIVRYSKPDGTKGFYDTDEDGNTAVTWTGNVATITLAEQVLTVPGNVLCQVNFYNSSEEKLSTFSWVIKVQQSVIDDETIASTDYFNVLTQQISAALAITAYPPYINATTHNWMTYDTSTEQYIDSGISAQGIQGEQGIQGVSVTSVTKKSGTGAAGTTDVYNVNLSNSTVAGTFNVYNGADGQGSPGSSLPIMDGTASAGSAIAYSREDHVHPSDTTRVPTSRTVNGKALSSNITLNSSDVGAVPTSRTVNDKALSSNITLDADDVGAVPTTRTVNDKMLSSDVTLSAEDLSYDNSASHTSGTIGDAIGKEILYYSGQTVSVASSDQIMRIPAIDTDDKITTDTIVLECAWEDPNFIVSDVGWQSYDGYIVFTGTCSTATTANVVLGTKNN